MVDCNVSNNAHLSHICVCLPFHTAPYSSTRRNLGTVAHLHRHVQHMCTVTVMLPPSHNLHTCCGLTGPRRPGRVHAHSDTQYPQHERGLKSCPTPQHYHTIATSGTHAGTAAAAMFQINSWVVTSDAYGAAFHATQHQDGSKHG